MSAAQGLLEPQFGEVTAAECVAFVDDSQTQEVVEAVARQFFDQPTVRQGGSQQALEYLSEFPAPRVIIVDIGEASAPLTAMLSLTAAFTEDTRLIGIGQINDVNLYREMVGAGITDYLVKPVTEKAMAAALSRAEEPVQAPTPTDDSSSKRKVNKIAVIGSRGGVGSSSVAVNLAWLMSEEKKQRTALIDLDLEFGTVALSLDIEPTRGLREALESPGRIDALFIESATAKLTERLSVMATEETLSADTNVRPEAIDLLFDALGRTNDCIIVDLPRSALALRHRVFEGASKIVVVCELNLPSLRDTMRLLTGIEEVSVGTPVTVIANRTGGTHQAMNPRDFQKALGHKVDLLIPEDEKAFNQAANNGKPLVQGASRSKAAKVMQTAANRLAEAAASPENKDGKHKDGKKSKKSWSSLFKRG